MKVGQDDDPTSGGLGEVVEDVAAAVAFYRDVLQLEVEHEEGNDYATINVPGILHWGLWDRRAAAESTLGDRDKQIASRSVSASASRSTMSMPPPRRRALVV